MREKAIHRAWPFGPAKIIYMGFSSYFVMLVTFILHFVYFPSFELQKNLNYILFTCHNNTVTLKSSVDHQFIEFGTHHYKTIFLTFAFIKIFLSFYIGSETKKYGGIKEI